MMSTVGYLSSFIARTTRKRLEGLLLSVRLADLVFRSFFLEGDSLSTHEHLLSRPRLNLDKLIDFDGEENTVKITRFANYLRIALPGSDPQTMVLASKALGRLALSGGTLTPDFVE